MLHRAPLRTPFAKPVGLSPRRPLEITPLLKHFHTGVRFQMGKLCPYSIQSVRSTKAKTAKSEVDSRIRTVCGAPGSHSCLTDLSRLYDLYYYIVMFSSAGAAHVNPVQIIKGGAVCSHACSLGLAIKYKKIGLSDQRPLVSGA